MAQHVPMAFEHRGLTLPLERILPLKQVTAQPKNAVFCRILTSIEEVGLIEPLIVYPQGGKNDPYSLLDGHLRLAVLRHLGRTEAPCLISTEDEAYTYNHKVNVVPPIQEHFMILKALQSGVPEQRLAAALNVDVAAIRAKRDLLSGICAEAVELLKDRNASREMLRELRKVKPMRQIEMVELMIASHNLSSSYAKCLLAATAEDQLTAPDRSKAPKGISPDELARMEREMDNLEQDFRLIKDGHGTNVLHLVLVTTYLRKLLDNMGVRRFLTSHYGDLLSEFEKLVDSTSLERDG